MKTLKSFYLAFLCLTLLLSLGPAPTQSQAQAVNDYPPTVDGVVDESYGPVIATDPAGDSQGGDPLDLVNLWMTQDMDNYYFAFEVNTDFATNNWGKYALILTRPTTLTAPPATLGAAVWSLTIRISPSLPFTLTWMRRPTARKTPNFMPGMAPVGATSAP